MKLKFDELHSRPDFNINLRRYTEGFVNAMRHMSGQSGQSAYFMRPLMSSLRDAAR